VPFFRARDDRAGAGDDGAALRLRALVQVERLGGARFRITAHRPLEITPSGDRHADTLAITSINALFGDWIRQRPGQWLWLHNRWPD
jgi:KDO2-lipid IV(A) lauroyltransferase